MAAKRKFVHRKPNGLWTYYNSDGTFHSKGNYVNGLREGVWLSYLDENGSRKYCSTSSDEQKLKVKNLKNIIDQYGIYKNGKQIKMKHRFTLAGS